MTSVPDLPVDFPAFAHAWAEKRMAQHVERTGRAPSTDEIRSLGDWLSSLPTDRPKMVDKLQKLTWAQAMDAQTRWHEEMARRAGKRTSFGGAPDDVERVLDLGDGWRWVRVLTPEGLDFEGEAMGHCVGGGSYDGATVYSLRGPDGMPHCTVQYDPKGRVVEQVKGRGNKEVVPRHHAAVRAFVDHLSPSHVRDAGLFGHVFLKATTWPRARLVSLEEFGTMQGMDVDGHLILSGCPSLVSLPEGLSVGGSSYLYGCTMLESLPSGLHVGGNLSLYRCTSLVSLPRGLAVRGDLYLVDCASLVSLPDGLTVGGHLSLSGCTSLVHLPNGLTVGERLYLYGCTSLVSLPDGLTIGGPLYLDGCVSLAALSKDVKVRRMIHGWGDDVGGARRAGPD